VNIASVAGLLGVKLLGTYSSTKFAVVGYSDALRREIQPKIRVTIIEPGVTRTPLLNPMNPEFPLVLDPTKTLFYENFSSSVPRLKNIFKKNSQFIQSADAVAQKVSYAILNDPAPEHVIVDIWIVRWIFFFSVYLPTSWIDFLMTKIL